MLAVESSELGGMTYDRKTSNHEAEETMGGDILCQAIPATQGFAGHGIKAPDQEEWNLGVADVVEFPCCWGTGWTCTAARRTNTRDRLLMCGRRGDG